MKVLERYDDAVAELKLDGPEVQAFRRELSKTLQYSGVTFHRQDDIERARADYMRALQLDPDNYSALDDLTALLLANVGRDTAVQTLTEILQKFGVHREEAARQVSSRYTGHAIDLKQAGHLEEAEQWYRHAIDVDPSYEKPYYNLGILCEQTGREAEAGALYRKAIDANRAYAPPYVRLGLTLESAGDVTGAAELLTAGVEAGAASEYLFANLGNCQLRLNLYSEADQSYRKALAVNDRHADAWNGLGAVLMIAGDATDPRTFEQACTYFRSAIEADATFEDARRNYDAARARLAGLS